jgi:hypothetical protein
MPINVVLWSGSRVSPPRSADTAYTRGVLLESLRSVVFISFDERLEIVDIVMTGLPLYDTLKNRLQQGDSGGETRLAHVSLTQLVDRAEGSG